MNDRAVYFCTECSNEIDKSQAFSNLPDEGNQKEWKTVVHKSCFLDAILIQLKTEENCFVCKVIRANEYALLAKTIKLRIHY